MLSLLRRLARLSTLLFGSSLGENGYISSTIGLVSFLAAASTLAGVIVTTGEFSAKQLEDVFHLGITRSSGSIEVRGSVIATASGAPLSVDSIQFSLSTVGRVDGLSLDPLATGDRLIISYSDGSFYAPDVPYGVRFLSGNGDNLLDTGEVAQIVIKASDIKNGDEQHSPVVNTRWTLELVSPIGGVVDVTRLLPPVLGRVMQLH